MENKSLTLVGCGIKFLSHLTHETKIHIEQADKVLYLVNDPAMKIWIQKMNPQCESLDFLYTKYPLRLDCYQAITNYIIDSLDKNQHVCVVLYGHPNVFSQPGLKAAEKAKQAGIITKILPGISAEDCLFADLFIDPGSCGCQSFEATDFLVHRRQFDRRCHLILWQIDVIGVLDNPKNSYNKKGIKILTSYLTEHYDSLHKVILYEAAQYPHFQPNIQTFPLSQLPNTPCSSISTLYIPPIPTISHDTDMLNIIKSSLTEID